MEEKEINSTEEMATQEQIETKNSEPKKGFWGKLKDGIGTAAQKTSNFVSTNTKKLANSIEQKIENSKLEKAKFNSINTAYEMKSKKFTIYYKDKKEKTVYCLYDSESKTLKLREKLDPTTIIKLQDEKHQDYYIEHIELTPYTFEHIFNDETLKMELEILHFTNKQEEAKTINNSINIQDSNISGAVGANCSADKNTKVGVDFNLLKKG